MRLSLLAALLFCVCITRIIAQEKSPAKFGKISPSDFKHTVYSVDSSANAVILADIGSTEIIGNTKGWFSLQFKHYRRIHILNKNGYDIADVVLRLYTDGTNEEKIDKLRAVTYNLENGRVIETKLDVKNSVFKDKINKNWLETKFTLPNVKEGSIIEYEYVKKSDYLNSLEPWEFQGKYPRVWSEYNFRLPGFFNYVFIAQGYHKFDVKESKESRDNFSVYDGGGTSSGRNVNFSIGVMDHRWVMKDVAPLKEEGFTSTLNNHISKIEFQLIEQKDPLEYHRYIDTWEKFTSDLLEAEWFGQQLNRDNGFLNDLLEPVIAGAKDDLDKAKRIFAFVRDNYTCTNHNRWTMDQNLRSVAKSHNGNVAEINLLLTAMLKHEDLMADPVLMSTREHGYVYPKYPLPDKFNYVICRVFVQGKNYYLDASYPRVGFGRLNYDCYNGHARIVDLQATPLELSSDSLLERSLSSVVLISDGQGNLLGNFTKFPGYYESENDREKIRNSGEEQFFSNIKKSFGTETEINDTHIDSLDQYDNPISLRYRFNMKTNGEDVLYVNPMFGEGWKENPFKSAKRLYPVEMPYGIDETYVLRMDVPAGYVLDELPKQIVVKMNEEGDAVFEYRLSESKGIISLRSRLRISRTFFLPEEYDMLREFFNLIVKKQSEQIVFKKKTT